MFVMVDNDVELIVRVVVFEVVDDLFKILLIKILFLNIECKYSFFIGNFVCVDDLFLWLYYDFCKNCNKMWVRYN